MDAVRGAPPAAPRRAGVVEAVCTDRIRRRAAPDRQPFARPRRARADAGVSRGAERGNGYGEGT